MNHQTEMDIALFGFAIQLESSAQNHRPVNSFHHSGSESKSGRTVSASHRQMTVYKSKK